jgi:hypothetical protein
MSYGTLFCVVLGGSAMHEGFIGGRLLSVLKRKPFLQEVTPALG